MDNDTVSCMGCGGDYPELSVLVAHMNDPDAQMNYVVPLTLCDGCLPHREEIFLNYVNEFH